MSTKQITVIDQTIREGMQHRGIVFSKEQRKAILEFQEELGVDICQAGYAPAHITEQEHIRYLNQVVHQNGYAIRVAGMGRASIRDVDSLVMTGVADFHLHANIQTGADEEEIHKSLNKIGAAVQELRSRVPDSRISIAILDIGAFSGGVSPAVRDSSNSWQVLERVSYFLAREIGIDILSLPDTSGIMSPDDFYDAVSKIVSKLDDTLEFSESDISQTLDFEEIDCEELTASVRTKISVHCHNDLGMASANTLMGVKAGATVVELSALGIGERNGIGDLFTVAQFLKNQGYEIRLDTDNINLFKAYYQYVSDICKTQTGEALLNYNTPFFGAASRTHVAGTHAGANFGIFKKDYNLPEEYFLNVLCGRDLVKRYLESMEIDFEPERLHKITEEIKSQSASLGRCLAKEEIIAIKHKTLLAL
ncbi:MAG: hypothetical protein HQK61_01405 [Desulfamplus sp.]|nr:hypothetical protein [Desulfamplus sp.]